MKILIKLLNYMLRPKYIVEYLLIYMNLYLCAKRLLSAYECLKIKDINIYIPGHRMYANMMMLVQNEIFLSIKE